MRNENNISALRCYLKVSLICDCFFYVKPMGLLTYHYVKKCKQNPYSFTRKIKKNNTYIAYWKRLLLADHDWMPSAIIVDGLYVRLQNLADYTPSLRGNVSLTWGHGQWSNDRSPLFRDCCQTALSVVHPTLYTGENKNSSN